MWVLLLIFALVSCTFAQNNERNAREQCAAAARTPSDRWPAWHRQNCGFNGYGITFDSLVEREQRRERYQQVQNRIW